MTTLTKTQKSKIDSFEYTSTKIRYLKSLGFKNYTISKILNIRPQMVSNILNHNVKNPKETF